VTKENEWWHEFFPTFRPVLSGWPLARTDEDVNYIRNKLGLRKGMTVLDCPCGLGRVSLPLAKQGMRVTGVDVTSSYLEELEAEAKKTRLKIELKHADMRRIDYDGEFDAVLNLWTSFGYFDKESDNLLVLKKFFRALKPGGRLVLQLINRDWIMANFSARDWYAVGDVKVLEEREFDYTRSISKGVWTFVKEGEIRSHRVSVRSYSLHELIEMFRKVGFVDIKAFGSTEDEPVSLQKRWMWLFGTRPKK
jgi:ubiquinone/menaquinone biosynthesis C-methylase UbiE